MTKLIRIFVAGLSLCGALAVLPQVAEAREPERPVPGHVVRDRGHEVRRHDARWHGEHRGEWRHGRDGRDCR